MFSIKELETLRDACAFTAGHAQDDMAGPEPLDRLAKVAEKIDRAIVNGKLNTLTAEYAAWNKAQGLDLGSADEHMFDESLTDEQRRWVRDFVRRWEETERGFAVEHGIQGS